MSRAVTAVALLGCAAGLTVLAACGGQTTGEPMSADTDTTVDSGTEPTVRTTSSAGETSEYSLTDLCGLLSADEATRLGGSAEGSEGNSTKDGHDQCRWTDATHLVISHQPDGESANAPTGPGTTNTPVEIDGLTAVQSRSTEPVDMCQVLVDLPSGDLISLGAAPLSAGEGRYEPCTVATEMANLVVPRVNDSE